MNESDFSRRSARASNFIAGHIGTLVVVAFFIAGGCGANSIDPGTAASQAGPTASAQAGSAEPQAGLIESVEYDFAGLLEPSGVAVLDAVTYSRPSVALDDATDAALRTHGDLLFSARDVLTGNVIDGAWCDIEFDTCVEVTATDPVAFGGEPLESFVLDAKYRVEGGAVEVIDVRALHHPVSDQLRLVLEIKPTEASWYTSNYRVGIRTETDWFEGNLEGSSIAHVGVTSRYELVRIEEPVSFPATILVTLSDGVAGGDTIMIEVEVAGSVPEIGRHKMPVADRPPIAIFRSREPLDDDNADPDAADAVAALIGAIVDGTDTAELVAPNSAGALAVAALQETDVVVRFRHDPTDDSSLCWKPSYRGNFCERWHAGVVDDGVLTGWSVEGTPIEELVVTRAGSVPGASVTLLRSPVGGVVLGATTVVNYSARSISPIIRAPLVQRGEVVAAALGGEGPSEVAEGASETGSALIAGSDFDFDLLYLETTGLDGDVFRFDANAESSAGGSDEASSARVASVRLASLLRNWRYDDAADETVPGSPAEAYLTALAAMLPDSHIWVVEGDEPLGSTNVCLGNFCTSLEVTATDADGRVSGLAIDGIDVETLILSDRHGQRGDFEATLEHPILWPKWGLITSWSVTNSSKGDVRIDDAYFVSVDGVESVSRHSTREELDAGRTVQGIAVFRSASFEGSIEFRGSGRRRKTDLDFTVAVPLADLEDDETESETSGEGK